MSTADTVAVGIFVVWAVLAFGVRVVIHYRQTGTTGLHGISPNASTAEILAEVLFVVSLIAGFVSPILEAVWSVPPILDRPAVAWLGFVIALTGVAATFAAQIAMGRSWRVGVDPSERTDLVTDGPFALVRNPIFSAMLITMLGFAMLVANVVAVASFVALVVSIELQVRTVEEPYLQIVHGDTYRDYITRVGRFVPGIGRSRTPKEGA